MAKLIISEGLVYLAVFVYRLNFLIFKPRLKRPFTDIQSTKFPQLTPVVVGELILIRGRRVIGQPKVASSFHIGLDCFQAGVFGPLDLRRLQVELHLPSSIFELATSTTCRSTKRYGLKFRLNDSRSVEREPPSC